MYAVIRIYWYRFLLGQDSAGRFRERKIQAGLLRRLPFCRWRKWRKSYVAHLIFGKTVPCRLCLTCALTVKTNNWMSGIVGGAPLLMEGTFVWEFSSEVLKNAAFVVVLVLPKNWPTGGKIHYLPVKTWWPSMPLLKDSISLVPH